MIILRPFSFLKLGLFGALIATVTQTTFCRADGGFGGPLRESPPAAGSASSRSRLPSPSKGSSMLLELPSLDDFEFPRL